MPWQSATPSRGPSYQSSIVWTRSQGLGFTERPYPVRLSAEIRSIGSATAP